MSDTYIAQIKDDLLSRFTDLFKRSEHGPMIKEFRLLQKDVGDDSLPVGIVFATRPPASLPVTGANSNLLFHLQLPPRYGKRRISGHFAKIDYIFAEEFITDIDGRQAWVERRITPDVLQCTLDIIQQLFDKVEL